MMGLSCAKALAPGKAKAAANTTPSSVRSHFCGAASRPTTFFRQTSPRARFIAPTSLTCVDDISVLEHVPPKLVPVGAGNVGHATVFFEEFVRHLEHRQHQPAFGRPSNMAAAGLAPDEFAGTDREPLRRTFLVDEFAFKNVGLLDLDMLVVRQRRAGRESHQG